MFGLWKDKLKIKTFFSENINELDNKVNEFINDKDVIEIKFIPIMFEGHAYQNISKLEIIQNQR